MFDRSRNKHYKMTRGATAVGHANADDIFA
jgi:hypothetical protein